MNWSWIVAPALALRLSPVLPDFDLSGVLWLSFIAVREPSGNFFVKLLYELLSFDLSDDNELFTPVIELRIFSESAVASTVISSCKYLLLLLFSYTRLAFALTRPLIACTLPLNMNVDKRLFFESYTTVISILALSASLPAVVASSIPAITPISPFSGVAPSPFFLQL